MDDYPQCASCQRTQVKGQIHFQGETFCDEYCLGAFDRNKARESEIRLQEGLLNAV